MRFPTICRAYSRSTNLPSCSLRSDMFQELTTFTLTPAAATPLHVPCRTVQAQIACHLLALRTGGVGAHVSKPTSEWERLAEPLHNWVRQFVVKQVSLTGSHSISVCLQLSSPTPTERKTLLAGTSCRLEAYEKANMTEHPAHLLPTMKPLAVKSKIPQMEGSSGEMSRDLKA